MKYRGIEYQVVQTAIPTGWRWTVQFDNERTRTGTGYNRTHAIGLAQRAIDKASPEMRDPTGQSDSQSLPIDQSLRVAVELDAVTNIATHPGPFCLGFQLQDKPLAVPHFNVLVVQQTSGAGYASASSRHIIGSKPTKCPSAPTK
jgi:hypothetical protein